MNEEFEEYEDGWGEEVRDFLDSIMSEAEELFYEIRNCVRGSYTNCTTKSELGDYLRNLAEQLNEAADEI